MVMAYPHTLSGAGDLHLPSIRRIEISDLKDALAKGIDDFKAMPSHAVFLGVIYPIVGLILLQLAIGGAVMPLAFPIVAGFALVGPFAALGLYELSRRREQGLDCTAGHAFDVFRSPSFGAIAALGLCLMVVFLVWLAVAQSIYQSYFGYAPPASVTSFLRDVFTTSAGWHLIVIGNTVGFLFALLVLVVSAVSFPLLLDRKVGAAVAVLTSYRAVLANPKTMAIWGLIVAVSLAIGSLPLLFGLAVVMPVLGHATWHLYRKVVVSE
jgi:uncharacterized membrane protein